MDRAKEMSIGWWSMLWASKCGRILLPLGREDKGKKGKNGEGCSFSRVANMKTSHCQRYSPARSDTIVHMYLHPSFLLPSDLLPLLPLAAPPWKPENRELCWCSPSLSGSGGTEEGRQGGIWGPEEDILCIVHTEEKNGWWWDQRSNRSRKKLLQFYDTKKSFWFYGTKLFPNQEGTYPFVYLFIICYQYV